MCCAAGPNTPKACPKHGQHEILAGACCHVCVQVNSAAVAMEGMSLPHLAVRSGSNAMLQVCRSACLPA